MMNRRMWAAAAGTAAALAVALGGCATAPAPGWVTVWSDTFTGPAGHSVSGAWAVDTDHGATLGTGEIEHLTGSPGNVRLDGHGNLQLIPLRDKAGGWTSGRVETKASYTAPPGGQMRVTATLKQPDPTVATGYWPAFWLLSTHGQEPGLGEIDAMEDVNSGTQTSGTLHCGGLTQANPDGTSGPCHEPDGLSTGILPCPGCSISYHTYAVIIDRRHPGQERISWYLDGHQTFSVTETQVGAAAWAGAVDHGFRIILDVAIGGGYPDAACRCQAASHATPGAAMSIASVTVSSPRR